MSYLGDASVGTMSPPLIGGGISPVVMVTPTPPPAVPVADQDARNVALVVGAGVLAYYLFFRGRG
jgi:hypothetical protein